MATLRILHVIPTLNRGGAERLALDIVYHLQKRDDVAVSLVVISDFNAYAEQSVDLPIRHVAAAIQPSLWRKTKLQASALQQYINDWQPDIIHTHLFQADFIIRYITTGTIPVVTHFHDNMPQYRPFLWDTLFRKKRLTNYYERWLLRKSLRNGTNRFLAISQHSLHYIQHSLQASEDKSILLHNAIDLKRFRVRGAGSQNEETIKLITVGSLVDKKNQLFLIEVMGYLPENYSLKIFGDGPTRQVIEAKIESEELANRVQLCGIVTNVEAYYTKSNMYVHAATYEPFGLVLLEAMASGLPVVTLDGGGTCDIIENGVNGFILVNHDPKEFAQKIIQLAEDPALYASMRQAALQTAQRYGMDAYIVKLLEIYRGVIDEAAALQNAGN